MHYVMILAAFLWLPGTILGSTRYNPGLPRRSTWYSVIILCRRSFILGGRRRWNGISNAGDPLDGLRTFDSVRSRPYRRCRKPR
jgi:hypothetical protein